MLNASLNKTFPSFLHFFLPFFQNKHILSLEELQIFFKKLTENLPKNSQSQTQPHWEKWGCLFSQRNEGIRVYLLGVLVLSGKSLVLENTPSRVYTMPPGYEPPEFCCITQTYVWRDTSGRDYTNPRGGGSHYILHNFQVSQHNTS